MNTTVENTSLQNMIGDVGRLIAGLQTTNKNKTLRETNAKKYEAVSPFAQWLDSLVKTEIKKAVWDEHQKAISLLQEHSDLIEITQNKVQETFITVFGEENLKCNTVNADKVFGRSIISKYSFLAKENGYNSNDVDRLIQSIIYKVLNNHDRL